MKKAVAVFLVLLLVLLGCVPAFAAEPARGSVPTVYIVGGNSNLFNAEGELVLPVHPPEGYIGDAVQDCIGDLAAALLQRTDEAKAAYKEKLLSWIAPLYEKAVMDQNGDPIGEYYPTVSWSNDPFVIPEIMPDYISGGVYSLRAYDFDYDYRLDPFVNAAKLNDYIEAIRRGTGADKVNIVGRCEGGTILMAYLAAYGHDKINKLFFNTTASNGYLLATAVFSGEMEFSAKEIRAFLNNNPNISLDTLDLSSLPAGEDLAALLVAFLDASAANPDLDALGSLVDALYTDLLREILPDVLLASYGTFPATWAMIDNEHFDAAVDYVFAGREEEYKGLIDRIVYYHENVSLHTEELLRNCEEDGVQIGCLTKYGYPAMPLCAESNMLSDGHSLVSLVSFGATAAEHDGTLNGKYINRRIVEGKGKYISPDKKIDASTGMFPDTSWFVGNLEHQWFPDMIDDLSQAFFLTDGMTVDTYAAWPQFMLFDEANYRFIPLTAENEALSTVGTEEGPSFTDASGSFAAALGNILTRIIRFIQNIIAGIVSHAKGTASTES